MSHYLGVNHMANYYFQVTFRQFGEICGRKYSIATRDAGFAHAWVHAVTSIDGLDVISIEEVLAWEKPSKNTWSSSCPCSAWSLQWCWFGEVCPSLLCPLSASQSWVLALKLEGLNNVHRSDQRIRQHHCLQRRRCSQVLPDHFHRLIRGLSQA